MENDEVDGDVEVVPVAKIKRKLTNEDVQKYDPMVEKFIRDSCVKNWTESKSGPEVFLGNSGYSLNDIRQHLRTEICIALQNYNPTYRTKQGRSVKESTFVYQHLTFRVGQMMKRLTKRRCGYGIRHNNFDGLYSSNVKESVCETDMASAVDCSSQYRVSLSNDAAGLNNQKLLKVEMKSQVEEFVKRNKSYESDRLRNK